MTYVKPLFADQPAANTVRLQGVGLVQGTPAGELKPGDTLLWNFYATSTVEEILKETKAFVTLRTSYLKDGEKHFFERRLKKSKIVGRPAQEIA